jgi:large subunit ribosomal protein L5
MVQLMKTSKQLYAERLPEILKKHGIDNKLAGPKIDKVALSMGVGRAVQDGQILNVVTEHLSQIAGQRAVVTKAKKAVANFRTRIGVKIGCRVTLRGERMWSFLDKLINLAVPRIKDFRGLSPRGFDGRGNYNMGLREQALFHEVTLEKLEHNQGLNITICIKNSTDTISMDLLKALNMPFRDSKTDAAVQAEANAAEKAKKALEKAEKAEKAPKPAPAAPTK